MHSRSGVQDRTTGEVTDPLSSDSGEVAHGAHAAPKLLNGGDQYFLVHLPYRRNYNGSLQHPKTIQEDA
jgi:hypothetical protein